MKGEGGENLSRLQWSSKSTLFFFVAKAVFVPENVLKRNKRKS